MAKGFASTTDLAEKKVTFSEIGTDLYAFTAEGDPNSAVIVGDDGCLVFDAQATPAMAGKVIERVKAVTDKPIKYVVLSHYHAVRVLGASAYHAQGIIASQETYRLIVERGGFPRYRHVLVDEIQDFGLEGLRLIAALSPPGEDEANPLSVFGDAHQRISRQAKIPLSRAGINVVGRSRRLKINYRTSEQIRRWAHSLLSGMDIDNLDGESTDTTGDRSVFRASEPVAVTVASRPCPR